MLLYAVVLLNVLNLSTCEECKLSKRSGELLVQGALESHLSSCSNLLQPPVNSNFTVPVTLGFVLHSFDFDYYEDTLTLYTWNYFTWQDDRLTWKPEDFSNINSTYISNVAFWTPGLKLFNNAELIDFDYTDYIDTICKVNSTGKVKCVVRAEHKVFCTSKLTNWPYDTKTCMLEFEQWRLGEAKVIFKLSHMKYVLYSTENSGWQILRDQISQNDKGHTTVKFDLERLAEGLEATIVVPCSVIASLTATALLLDYKKNTRLGILSLSLISHFVFLNEISIHIPKYSQHVPVVLFFISRSTLLTIIVFVVSFGFKLFAKKSNRPVVWVSTVSDSILSGWGRYVVVTSWDVDSADSKPLEWTNFVNILNSVCLFIVIIVYICLFVSYMPVKDSPVNDFEYV